MPPVPASRLPPSDADANDAVIERRHRRGPIGTAAAAVDIVPPARWPGMDVRELWQYRELFLFLVWRDVKVRYAQTVLGVGWAIVQPLATVVVFTIVFGHMAGIPSDGAPYAVFSLAALIPWTYFSGALSGASNSLVSNVNLITKVYFPRLVIPLASVLGGLVNFAVTLALLLVVMLGAGILPSPATILVVPLLLLVMMMTAAGVGCWLGALALQYRDVRNVAAFLVQLWMYVSPVVYPLSLVPEAARPIYLLNPMVGVIEGFRASLLGTAPVPWPAIAVSAAVSALLLVTGLIYFRGMEQTFADVA
jgi:lipopolysaccharide transport system permease protein